MKYTVTERKHPRLITSLQIESTDSYLVLFLRPSAFQTLGNLYFTQRSEVSTKPTPTVKQTGGKVFKNVNAGLKAETDLF